MKESLIKIKNKLKRVPSFKRINPHIYWNNLLYMFFTIIIILILFSFYLLYQIKNQQVFQNILLSTESPSLINEKLFEKVKESFNNKLIKQKQIQSETQTYKDPSIN